MYDRKIFDPFFVGFDDVIDKLSGFNADVRKKNMAATNYPPYNIRKVDDNKFVIEMAVAGFGRHEIDVTIEDGTLTVTGEIKSLPGNQVYLFKGIADRAFRRTFTVADTIEIRNAELFNGMLRVWLENLIPEHKKSRKIDVTEVGEKTEKTFLAE